MEKRKVVVAITGASGSIYAKVLFDRLSSVGSNIEVGVVMSDNAMDVWKQELGNDAYNDYSFSFYSKTDFSAPFASGSANYDSMIICPCSMGTLGRIATGVSNDLISRAADVILKERRRLVLVTRDTPLNLIHINNMKTVSEAGGIICPAAPSFYSRPRTLEDVASTVVERIMDLVHLPVKAFRWGGIDGSEIS